MITDMLKSCNVAITLFNTKKGSHPWLGKSHHNYDHLVHDVTLSTEHFCLEELEQLATDMSRKQVRMAPTMRILPWCTVSTTTQLSDLLPQQPMATHGNMGEVTTALLNAGWQPNTGIDGCQWLLSQVKTSIAGTTTDLLDGALSRFFHGMTPSHCVPSRQHHAATHLFSASAC